MKTVSRIFVLMLLFAVVAQRPASSQTIFANDFDGGVYIIGDCISTHLCTSTLFSDIAWQGGVLYGTAGMTIYAVDTATGIATQVAAGTQGISYTGMAGDGSGNLYLCDFSGVIYRYQIATGLFNTAGNTGTGCNGDIAFIDDTIFMTGTGNNLVRITLNPFSSTVVGTMSFPVSTGNSYGLVPAPVANTLYASARVNGVNKLFSVNTSSAATTLLCDSLGMITPNIFGLASDLEDISTGNGYAEANDDFLLFPNPASDHLIIQPTGSQAGEYKMQVINLQGSQLMAKQIRISGGYLLELPDLSNGIYILTLQNSQGRNSLRFSVCR